MIRRALTAILAGLAIAGPASASEVKVGFVADGSEVVETVLAPRDVQLAQWKVGTTLRRSGFPVERVPVYTLPADALERSYGPRLPGAIAVEEGTVLGPTMARRFAYEETGPRVSLRAFMLLAHEALHRFRGLNPSPTFDLAREEGLVSAVAFDITVRESVRRTGKRPGRSFLPDYPREVQAIRWHSIQATCSPWDSRDGRVWRRAALFADEKTRDEMFSARCLTRGR